MHPLTPEQEQRARERAAAMLADTPQAVDQDLQDCSDAELMRFAAYPVRPATWQALEESERRSLRAANMLAKRERDAAKRAELEAEAAKHQAQNDAELEAYKQQTRATFKGSRADFDRLWPALRDAWLLDQVSAGEQAQRAALEQKRRTLDYSL